MLIGWEVGEGEREGKEETNKQLSGLDK